MVLVGSFLLNGELQAAADTRVQQVDVGPQGEAGVGVAEPLLHLLMLRPSSKRSEAQVWRNVWKVTDAP